MKNIANLLLYFLCGIIILSSCKDMDDIHSEFLKDGDIIYAPKPLLTQSFGGKNRVKLKYYLLNAVNVNKCVVEWNEGTSTQTLDITPKLPLDSLEIIINELEEKSYIFNIYTIDTHGNRSVKEQITGSAYDTKYVGGLHNRPLLGFEGGGTVDSIIVSWSTPAEGNVGVELAYNNRAGDPVTKMVLPEEDEIVIRDWESEGQMSYRSFYVPEPMAIDTFSTEAEQVVMPLYIEFKGVPVDKTNWIIVDLSGEEPAEAQWGPDIQGLAAAAIDNDPTTFWHSPWDGQEPEHPHHITIDLGAVVKMNAFELTKRQNKNDCMKQFTVEVSMDNTNFTSLGTYTYEQASASQRYQTNDLPLARYIRYTAVEAYDDKFYTHLAEFSIEGIVADQIDRSSWEVTDLSTEEPAEGGDPNGLVIAALDGELGTYWHTQWSGGSPDYPHYFVIDMKQQVTMLAVECFRRQGDDRGQNKYKIHTSNDGVNFEEQGTFDFDNTSDAGQTISLPFMPQARYFKYEAIEGPNNFAFLAELYVYGTTEP